MIVRSGRSSDGQAMIEILQEIVDIGGTTAFEGTVPATFLEGHLSGTKSGSAVHVAEADGNVIGFQYIEPHPSGTEGLAQIATFAKVGGTQRGIGSALFVKTRVAALALGYDTIDATIRADNAGGLAYYARMGFADHSVRKGQPLSDGSPVDRVSKRLKIIS